MSKFVIAGYAIHWRFPSEVERLAYPAKASEVNKIAYQEDTKSFWLLANSNPIDWQEVGGGNRADDLYLGDPLMYYILAKAP